MITKLLQFSILGEVRSGVSRTTALGFQRVDFGLFGSLVDRVPRQAVPEGQKSPGGLDDLQEENLKGSGFL